jgi:hypothetical protein
MKGSRIYMLFLGLFLVLVFLFEYMSPHEFVWRPTFDGNDREPFGCYVFDDVVSSSVDSYTVTDKTFYRITREDSASSPRAFLIAENDISFNGTDIECLYKLLHAGNQVMICGEYFSYTLEDTLGFHIEYESYLPPVIRYISENRERDSIFFGRDTLNPECIYEVYPQMHPVRIVAGKTDFTYEEDSVAVVAVVADSVAGTENDMEKSGLISAVTISPMTCDSMEVLVWNKENEPLAIRAFIGKGELFLVSTPLMFTNYGILDGNNASYAFRLLSCMKGRPLTRIEAYGDHSKKAGTPLRYVLSEPPLKWAVYSILMLLILFMVFTARRRQRVIPLVKPPVNRTFGFMQLVSNLYYQKHENDEMLKMKHLYFCAEVKRLTGVDLQENVPDESVFTRLSEKTGTDTDFIRTLIKNINIALYRSEVSDIQLKQYVDGMNDILYAL